MLIDDIKPDKTAKWLPLLLLVISVLMTLLAFVPYFKHRPFAILSANEYLWLLARFFILALIVERASEVLVKAWRGAGRNEREYALKEAKALKTDERDSKVQQAQLAIGEYTARTARFALIVGTLLGIGASLAGVRIIRPLLDPAFINVQRLGQPWFLNWVDVVVTGALVGGGSAGIHQIVMAVIGIFDVVRENQRKLIVESKESSKPKPVS